MPALEFGVTVLAAGTAFFWVVVPFFWGAFVAVAGFFAVADFFCAFTGRIPIPKASRKRIKIFLMGI